MSRYKLKIDFSYFDGVMFGVGFPMTEYVSITICILCFAIHINWNKR